MKKLTKIALSISVVFLGFLAVSISDSQEVFLESWESRTVSGGSVFNKIKWFSFKDKDVWMMNQSHHGSQALKNKWERLAIVVDKTKSPITAKFFQLKPGPLEWADNLEQVPLRISCFMCHANGPRAIRPNYKSAFNPMGFKERVKVLAWNIRIKSYGRVVPHKSHKDTDQNLVPPFRWRSDYENEPLKISTCLTCHKEQGFFARGRLRRQNIPTIKFMLETGQMPPIGFWLSKEEKIQMEHFLAGF